MSKPPGQLQAAPVPRGESRVPAAVPPPLPGVRPQGWGGRRGPGPGSGCRGAAAEPGAGCLDRRELGTGMGIPGVSRCRGWARNTCESTKTVLTPRLPGNGGGHFPSLFLPSRDPSPCDGQGEEGKFLPCFQGDGKSRNGGKAAFPPHPGTCRIPTVAQRAMFPTAHAGKALARRWYPSTGTQDTEHPLFPSSCSVTGPRAPAPASLA